MVRTSHLTVRPLQSDEIVDAHALLALVFADPVDPADIDAERSVFEAERSLGTFDGDELVGCMSTYSFDMSVPGGTAPVAGTTWVGVSPTHRRRGVLHGMMRRHLHDIADRGEPLAALWASETAIYGRYGYGSAIDTARLTIALDGGLQWADTAPPAADQVTLIPIGEAHAAVAPIWDACRRRRAGMHARSEAWWHFQILSTRAHATTGGKKKYVALAEVDGRDAAYAVYTTAERWDDHGRAKGTLTAMEVAGLDSTAEAAMWRFLLSHDLMGHVSVPRRPVDDPLPLLLTDSRRVQRRISDGLHVRVIDVPAALQARAYADSAAVTVEVVDETFEGNDDTWRIEVAPEGSAVTPDPTSTPDLRMPVKALGSLYMGDVGIHQLAAAGLVEVANPAVLTAVDNAFRAPETGWAAEVW